VLSPAKRIGPLLLGACALLGCASTTYDPPAWINDPPIEDGFIYGIGSYVGALHPEDNQGYAVEQARGMLSRNLSSRVVNSVVVRETNAESSLSSDTLVSSEYVLKNSELVSSWVDYGGTTGRRGTVWVLMRIGRP
jgi:hypothetical protein